MADRNLDSRYDVVILGGGLAGQTLARHLLLETERTVLMVERLDELPTWRQKYGESSVQVAGFYYSRVLDMEEYLLGVVPREIGRHTRRQALGERFMRHFAQPGARRMHGD